MAESGNRVRKLAKDVGVYALGNIGSKLITFMMIPLYTYFINAADFGFAEYAGRTVRSGPRFCLFLYRKEVKNGKIRQLW